MSTSIVRHIWYVSGKSMKQSSSLQSNHKCSNKKSSLLRSCGVVPYRRVGLASLSPRF